MGSSMNETGAPEPPDDEPMGPVVDVSVAKGPSTRAKSRKILYTTLKKVRTPQLARPKGQRRLRVMALLTKQEVCFNRSMRREFSHQTTVPQADPNIANESFDAQRASVSAPTDPIKGGMPAQAAPGLENLVAQAGEFFEGTGRGVSPFQAGGAMNELSASIASGKRNRW